MDSILSYEMSLLVGSHEAPTLRANSESSESAGPQNRGHSPTTTLDQTEYQMEILAAQIGAVHAIKWLTPDQVSVERVFGMLAWFALQYARKLRLRSSNRKWKNACIIA